MSSAVEDVAALRSRLESLETESRQLLHSMTRAAWLRWLPFVAILLICAWVAFLGSNAYNKFSSQTVSEMQNYVQDNPEVIYRDLIMQIEQLISQLQPEYLKALENQFKQDLSLYQATFDKQSEQLMQELPELLQDRYDQKIEQTIGESKDAIKKHFPGAFGKDDEKAEEMYEIVKEALVRVSTKYYREQIDQELERLKINLMGFPATPTDAVAGQKTADLFLDRVGALAQDVLIDLDDAPINEKQLNLPIPPTRQPVTKPNANLPQDEPTQTNEAAAEAPADAVPMNN